MHLGHGALSTTSKTDCSSVGNGPLEASGQEQSTGPGSPRFRKMERKAVGGGTCSKGVRQVVMKASPRAGAPGMERVGQTQEASDRVHRTVRPL